MKTDKSLYFSFYLTDQSIQLATTAKTAPKTTTPPTAPTPPKTMTPKTTKTPGRNTSAAATGIISKTFGKSLNVIHSEMTTKTFGSGSAFKYLLATPAMWCR